MAFRLICFFAFICGFVPASFSQCTDCPNTIVNSTFDGNGSWQAFAQSDVPNWQAAFGSPSLIYYNSNPPGNISPCSTGAGNQGTLHTLLFSRIIGNTCDGDPVVEGAFQEGLSILVDEHYSYCMDFGAFTNPTLGCGHPSPPNVENNHLQIYLANGLNGINTTTDACLIDLAGFQEVFNQNILNTTLQDYAISDIVPSQNYTQVLAFNELIGATDENPGIVFLDDLELHCELTYPSVINVSADQLEVDFDLDVGLYVLDQIKWNFGDGSFSSEMSPSHTYDEAGVYEVCVSYIDENECCGEVCKSISLNQQCDYEACIWQHLTCSAGGGGLEVDDVQVLLPDGTVLKLADKNESNGCQDCVFNFPYCLFSLNNWQNYCSDYYVINDNIDGPFYQDLNQWLTLNNFKGDAYHGDFTNSPCRAGTIKIDNTNVRFQEMVWSNNAPPNACFDIEQIVPFTESCFTFQGSKKRTDRTVTTTTINVFPNPATSILNITVENSKDVTLGYQLLNLSGEVVMNGLLSELSSTTHELRINHPAGIYILKVEGALFSHVEKILIQR